MKTALTLLIVALVVGASAHGGGADAAGGKGQKGWQRGAGWGWIWGAGDQVGALNAQGPPAVLRALALARRGRVHDLGLTYDRDSYRSSVHNPGEIISYRSPEGLKRSGDSTSGITFHSAAVFISDNVGTQIDGLGHIAVGADDHWYNGFTEREWGGDFGVRKAGAETIPPIVATGVLIDVAGHHKQPALPSRFAITVDELKAALAWQGVDVAPGDVVLIRTGTGGLWGEAGHDHAAIAAADSAGIDLAAAPWLVEQKGALMIGSDTSALECPPRDGSPFLAVHRYLLVEQGVHVGELHDLESLARARAYRFAYVALVNKIKGTSGGFALRPIAID